MNARRICYGLVLLLGSFLQGASDPRAPRPSNQNSIATISDTPANTQAITTNQNPRALTLAHLTVTEKATIEELVAQTIITDNINITNINAIGTSTNTPNTLVLRDDTGSFAAETVTATNAVLTNLPTAAQTGNVYIDGSGQLYVGLSGEGSGTSSNIPNTAVVRDSTGSFAAQNIELAGSLEPLAPSTTLDLGVNTAQTVNLGNSSATDTINIGTGTALQIINVGTGTGETIINLGSPGGFVNIAGTLTYVSATDLTVVNKLITVNASGGVASGFNSGIQVEEAGIFDGYVKTSGDRASWLMQAPASPTTISLNPANIATIGVLHSDASGNISTSLVVNADVSASAGIIDTKLATIIAPGKVANTATTATPFNIPNAIVARDVSGGFSAGTITGNQFVGTLNGNVTGSVGGQSATNVANATTTVLAATSNNLPNTLVMRDPTGSFSAGTITANQFIGTLAGTSGGFSGALHGDVTGTQCCTSHSYCPCRYPNQYTKYTCSS